MSKRRVAFSLLLGGVAAATFASSAYSFTLTDDPSVSAANTIYYGANNTFNGQDVIGTSTFNIIDAVVSRSGSNNNTLNIIINTNYAGAPGTGAAEGTNYGSLFLNPLVWSVTGTPVNNYSTDNFVGGNQNWAYAVTTPTSGAGTSNLYATGLNPIGPSGAGAPTNSNGVPQYYTTADGKINMSNVGGNPLSAPAAGNPGFYFRQGQAVTFDPTVSDPSLGSVTVTKVDGSFIEYSIVDGGLLGDTFALSWAMTCANDVIQGLVTLPSTDLQSSTPLPAALPLFVGGLGGMGLLARRRKRKSAAVTV